MVTVELKSAAKRYWLDGCNIVLLKGKEPLHRWQRWQTERQNELDFEALSWAEADGFAIICGQQLHNEQYVGAIDFDVKNLPLEVVEKGKYVLKHLPITQMEETPSGGQHYIYFSHAKPKTISAYHNDCALEILGEGKLCIMAPSQGYRKLNDNTPTEVEDLEVLFYSALEKAGVKVEKPAKLWFDNEELSGKPYRGKDPPCIQALLKGTQEGLRNEFGIRLASYFINFKQYNSKTVRQDILKSWNKLNTPELHWKELDSITKSAVQGRYVYGCTDPILKSQCDREKCPIAPKQPLAPEEKQRALKLLEDAKFLDYVVNYGRRRLIGEDNVLLTNFVLICSGQTRYPISAIIEGFSGSGKNESLRALKPLFPEECVFEFTTSTAEALKYLPEEFSGTLLVYEVEGALKSETGTIGLRAVGEGESIETIYPVRDEATGKMKLERAKTNAKNFVTTSSDVDVHADLLRRTLRYSMNHARGLTKRVIAKEMREARFPESLRKILGLEESTVPFTVEDFRNALRLNDWKAETILFSPSELVKIIDLAPTKESEVALRTHIKKIKAFVSVLALIHQKNRINLYVGQNHYVIASPEDWFAALKILKTTLLETIKRLGKRQQEVLELFEENETLDKNKVAEKLKVSGVTAHKILKALSRAGYLKEISTTKPYNYELLRENNSKQFVILEEKSEYERFWRMECEKWLRSTLSTCHSRGIGGRVVIKDTFMLQPFLPGTEEKSRQGEFEATPSFNGENKPKPFFFSEKTRENEPVEQNQESWIIKREGNKVFAKDGNVLYQCDFCKGVGKPMFFATKHDLDLHVVALHFGYPTRGRVMSKERLKHGSGWGTPA